MTDDPPGESERLEAQRLSRLVSNRSPRLVRLGTIDLLMAFEHALFAALRSGSRERPAGSPVRGGPLRWAAPFGRLALATRPWMRRGGRVAGVEHGGVLVITEAAIHARLLAPVAEVLKRDARLPVHVAAVSPAADPVDEPAAFASVTRLVGGVDASWLWPLAAHAGRVALRGRAVTDDWPQIDPLRGERMRALAADALPRLALAAARLISAVDRVRPDVLAAYDETGIWGRLVPAVAHARDLPAVDLPHGEAANPWGSVGIGYDIVAVYGPQAASVMRAAGIADERIALVGAARYDRLVRELGAGYSPWTADHRTVLLASQPVHPGGDHTQDSKAAVLRAALAIAGAVAPSTLMVRPHPTERDGVNEETLAAAPLPAGVEVRFERARDLHDLLPHAWLMVTAFSQSTFEAAIAGVPTISVNTTGNRYAAQLVQEGIALAATDESSAVEVARGLVPDDARRAQVVLARQALGAHLGVLDGRAAERTAQLIARLASQRGD